MMTASAKPASTARRPAAWRTLANLPLALALLLGAFVLCPRVNQNVHLFWSFAGVSGGLVCWFVLLRLFAGKSGRTLAAEAVPPVRQHYIQAAVQIVLYCYWGWFWVVDGVRPIFAQAPLIVAQFVYLYAFDALWSWTRGRAWRLASGPTPIVLSTNLFIWFEDDWFIWQFAMITAGLLGKEFIRWQKDGRRTHVFNPSGFGLACAATVLIVTGTTDLTWAKPLATTIEVQHIFVVIFLLGLVVQHFFAVTLMTFAAAVVMVICNLTYTWTTGVYLFGSSNLPAAAFLGLHLLMTDPSTSPRSNVGRTAFGALYGLGYVVAFEVLGRLGAPELYAKLYPVPILNCSVQLLDRWGRTGAVGRLNHRWEHGLPAKIQNGIHMGLWAALFAVLLGTGYLDGEHPGDSITFWKRAVAEQRHDAQRKLIMVAGSQAVGRESGDAYNELGLLSLTSDADPATELTRRKSAANWFALAAQRGSAVASINLVQLFLFHGVHRSDDDLGRALLRLEQLTRQNDAHAAFLLGLAFETGGARPVDGREALAIYRRCPSDYIYAVKGIARLGLQSGARLDLSAVAPMLAAAAAAGDGESCYYLAYMHGLGRGVDKDARRARTMLRRAAELGFEPAIGLAIEPAEISGREQIPPFREPRRKFLARPPWATAFPT